MKTISTFTKTLSVAVAAAFFTSCLGDNEQAFTVNLSGYILQEVEEQDEVLSYSYYPFLQVVSIYGHTLTSCSAQGPGGMPISLTKYSNYEYISNLNATFPSSVLPVGSYTASATNDVGETLQVSASFVGSTIMPNTLKGSVVYNPENYQVNATFNKMENATDYVLILESVSQAGPFSILKNWSEATLEDREWVAPDASIESMIPLLGSGTYRLSVATMIANTTSTILLQKGASTTFTIQ